MPFLNKIVIITGAGSGIGEKTALKFAKLNARLALIDKNQDTLNKSADECEKVSKTKVYRVAIDLTVDTDVNYAIDEIVKQFGRIDVVVNCAGIYYPNNLADKEYIQVFDKIYNINMRSIALITHLTAKHLIKTKGNVVNLSSIVGVMPTNFNGYAAAKAVLIQFSKTVAMELAPKGVRVNCILPGYCQTNLLINAGIPKEASNKTFESVIKDSPLKRNISGEEISEMVAFLASDKARSITGASYVIDAGLQLVGSQVFKEEDIKSQILTC